MWKFFLFAIVGWLSARQILYHWHKKRILREHSLVKSDLILLMCSALAMFFAGSSLLQLWFSDLIMIMVLLFIPFFVEMQRRKQFRSSLLLSLDVLALSLRAGKSFNEALQDAVSGTNAHVHSYYFTEISQLILSKQSNQPATRDPMVLAVYQELKTIQQSAFRVADRLKAFRHSLGIEFHFKRKSRAATLQARAQSWFMLLLFAAVAVYQMFSVGLREHFALYGVGAMIFAAGTIWVQMMGRNHKWKI